MTCRLQLLLALLALVLHPGARLHVPCGAGSTDCDSCGVPADDNTDRFYPIVAQTDPGAPCSSSLCMSMVQTLRFLVDDLSSYTGPPWTVVECYNDGASEVPPNPSDVDSFTNADVLDWAGDGSGLVPGDAYCVLESADSDGDGSTNHFQFYIALYSTLVMQYALFPLEDFATGGAIFPPTFPATIVGDGGALPVQLTTVATAADLSIVADEGRVYWMRDSGGTLADWFYVGEVDGALTTGTPADDRPYVLRDNPAYVYYFPTAPYWNRLSPVDDATRLVVGYSYEHHGAHWAWQNPFGALLGIETVWPVAIAFEDAGHMHRAGYLRGVYAINEDAGNGGTLNSKQFMYRNNSGGIIGGVVVVWDGVTAYGADSAANVLGIRIVSR